MPANLLVKYILVGVILIARPVFGQSTSSASGIASSSTGGNEGFTTTTTHQSGIHQQPIQSSPFGANQFLQGLMNTPGLAGLAGGLGGAGGAGGGAYPGMAGYTVPPGGEFGGPGGFVGPSYIPYTWLGSLAGFKGDIIFPLLIIGFVLVGIWTAIQFFMGLIVPWVAAKSWDGGPSAGASFSVAKSGSVSGSGSSRFLRDLGTAMNPNLPNGGMNMDMLHQIVSAIQKSQTLYDTQTLNNTMSAKEKPGVK